MPFVLNGTVNVSAESPEQPSLLIFGVADLSMYAESEYDEANQQSLSISANGTTPVDSDEDTISQANLLPSFTHTLVSDAISSSNVFSAQALNLDIRQSDETRIGTLLTFYDRLNIQAPLNLALDITTHSGLDFGNCSTGELTLETSDSSLDIRFSNDSAIATLNGVQQLFDDCQAFHDWLNKSPINLPLP